MKTGRVSAAKNTKKSPQRSPIKPTKPTYKQKMEEISSLFNSLFISPQDLKQISDMFQNLEDEGQKIDMKNPNSEEIRQFHLMWNNFLQNIQEYFNIPPEKRLEHFIKSCTRQLYELIKSEDFNKNHQNSSISRFYSLLDSLANKYQDDIEHTQAILYDLQADLIQIKTILEPFETKEQCAALISKMLQATEELDNNEKNVKAVLKKINDYTNYFDQTFPSEAREEDVEEESAKSSSSSWTQPDIDVQKENELEQERKRISDELNASLAKEQRLNSQLDQIKAEIANTRLECTKYQLTKEDLGINTEKTQAKQRVDDLNKEIDELNSKIKILEKQKSEQIKRQKLEEENQRYFAADASIYNGILRNTLRYIKQYESQIDSSNRDISAIIKEIKSIASGGIEGQTVSFSNHQFEESLKEQDSINEKLLDDKQLLEQQQLDFDEGKLLDVSCSSVFQDINNMDDKIELVQKHQEMLKNENNALRVRKRLEEENIEMRARRLDAEITKWENRIEEMKKYEIEDVPKPVLTTEIFYRNEFDPIQDYLEERKDVQVKYHKLKKQENADQAQISQLKRKYAELTNKISDSGHKAVYEELIKLQTDLYLLREAYRDSMMECIDRRSKFVDMFACVGDLETNICMALREIEKRGLQVDYDEELTEFITRMFVDKLSKAAELKKVYDWLDENFEDESVRNETKLKAKIEAALEIVHQNSNGSDI